MKARTVFYSLSALGVFAAIGACAGADDIRDDEFEAYEQQSANLTLQASSEAGNSVANSETSMLMARKPSAAKCTHCEKALDECISSNSRKGPDDLLKPCALYYSSCISDCLRDQSRPVYGIVPQQVLRAD